MELDCSYRPHGTAGPADTSAQLWLDLGREPGKGEIPRYLDDGSTQAYKLQAVSFRFDEESGVSPWPGTARRRIFTL